MHHNFVTSPEQNNGSSNQASLSNILQRPNTTRSMPHDFALEQGNQPATKRRKSGGTTFVNPPHQSDQAYMQQGTYHHFVQQPTPYNYFLSNSPVQQMSSIQQPMTVTSSRISNNVVPTTRPRGIGFADALPQAAVLPTSSQIISNQNNHHASVPSQTVSQQIGFQNQFQQINNNSQQQVTQHQMLQHTNNQGSMQQITLEMLRPQIALYPLQQQSIHTSTILDNPMYDNIPTSNLSTQDSTQYIIQRLEIFKVEIENKAYFQPHCEELNNYLQNENVYSAACQDALVQCLESVKLNSLYSLDIAIKVFRNAVNNLSRFNTLYQNKIKRWYSELKEIKSTSSRVNRVVRQQQQQMLIQQQQQMSVPINQPRIDQRPATDIEKSNANWISRIIDRAWGHVMLPYESQMINQHQSSQQEFINSFYVPHFLFFKKKTRNTFPTSLRTSKQITT